VRRTATAPLDPFTLPLHDALPILGDAFASGGSAGYDHKEMAITARGAWESVRRHFRHLDLDPDTDDFSVVGIGDMSGDVFGEVRSEEHTSELQSLTNLLCPLLLHK